MYTRLISAIIGAVSTFVRYSVSTLGYKRVLAETAGFFAFNEVVDFAAEHSDWVKQNKESILALSLIANVGGFAGVRSKAALAKAFNTAALYSKLKILSSGKFIASYLSSMKVEAYANGCKIAFNQGRDFLKVSVSNGKLAYEHSGHPAAAILLAGGFGAKGIAESLQGNDWKSTAVQLSMVLADLQHQHEKDTLTSKLSQFDEVDLLVVGPQVIRAFKQEYPLFSSETAASLLIREYETESSVFGNFSLDAWRDEDDVFFIAINNQDFLVEQDIVGSKVVLKRGISNGRTSKALQEKEEDIFETVCALYSQIARLGQIDLLPIPDSTRYVATPVVVGSYAATIVWDEETRDFITVLSTDSLFEDAADGLIDEYDTTLAESVSATFTEIGEWLGLSKAAPVHGVSTVSGSDLAAELGK